MKERNLSGFYFRVKRENEWDNVCFEDLTEKEQDEILNKKDIKFIISLAKGMAKVVREIGDNFDIIKE